MHLKNLNRGGLLLVPLLLLVAAGCIDQSPTDVAPPVGALFHSADGECPENDDFHFGDNCVDPDGNAGTHLRLAHVSWVATENPNEAEFTFTFGSRASFYSGISVGNTRTFVNVNFGDGSSANPAFTVTFVDTGSDWFEARATFRKQYAGAGPYTVLSQSCCRLSPTGGAWAHPNNPDGGFRITAVVDFQAPGSPVTSLAPIVPCAPNAPCNFTVASTAPGGQQVRYRMATSPEATSSGTFNQPAGASIDANTGLYSWNTTGAAVHPTLRTVYSTQVAMETIDGLGAVTSRSAIDFLIEISGTANAPPVWDRPPTPDDGEIFTVAPGEPLSFGVAASDPDAGDVVTLGALGLPAGATFPGGSGNPASSTFSFTPTAAQLGQSYIVNFLASDQNGASAPSLSIRINVEAPPAEPAAPPVADAGSGYTGVEGSSVQFDGTDSFHPDGLAITTYSWDFGDGNTGSGSAPSHTYLDNGTYTVTLTVEDENGLTDEATAQAVIDNAAPVVGPIQGLPTDPVGAGLPVSLSASFTDPGVLDTHTAVIDWGDGTTTTGTVAQGAGSGTVTGGHTYQSSGIYTVEVTVTDNDGDSGNSVYEYVVVYDPDGGFVTGGGWIDVPTGSYMPDLTASGPARFGFVAKYLRGRSVPDGNTQFQFRAVGLNFHSTSYDWLVVAGARAQYKGEGRINQQDGYCFMLTAIDSDVNGGGDVDRLRLRIWDCDTEVTVFDNQMGESDDDNPTAITRGSIVIHR